MYFIILTTGADAASKKASTHTAQDFTGRRAEALRPLARNLFFFVFFCRLFFSLLISTLGVINRCAASRHPSHVGFGGFMRLGRDFSGWALLGYKTRVLGTSAACYAIIILSTLVGIAIDFANIKRDQRPSFGPDVLKRALLEPFLLAANSHRGDRDRTLHLAQPGRLPLVATSRWLTPH